MSPNSNVAISAPSASSAALTEPPKPWAKRPDEPPELYDRFVEYLRMGPTRNIEKLYAQRARTSQPELRGKRASSSWSRKAREWNWKARAFAYDEESRAKLLVRDDEIRIKETEDEAQLRLAGKTQRREIVNKYLEKVTKAIDAAELDTMDVIMARMHLQTLGSLFVQILKAHRLELGEPTEIQNTNIGAILDFTADDLAEAQRQLIVFRKQQEEEDNDAQT